MPDITDGGSIYSKRLSRGKIGTIGMYHGATWRIQLNRPCAVAMPPYVRLLLLLVNLLIAYFTAGTDP